MFHFTTVTNFPHSMGYVVAIVALGKDFLSVVWFFFSVPFYQRSVIISIRPSLTLYYPSNWQRSAIKMYLLPSKVQSERLLQRQYEILLVWTWRQLSRWVMRVAASTTRQKGFYVCPPCVRRRGSYCTLHSWADLTANPMPSRVQYHSADIKPLPPSPSSYLFFLYIGFTNVTPWSFAKRNSLSKAWFIFLIPGMIRVRVIGQSWGLYLHRTTHT